MPSFASKGLGVRVPLAPPLVRAHLPLLSCGTFGRYSRKYSNGDHLLTLQDGRVSAPLRLRSATGPSRGALEHYAKRRLDKHSPLRGPDAGTGNHVHHGNGCPGAPICPHPGPSTADTGSAGMCRTSSYEGVVGRNCATVVVELLGPATGLPGSIATHFLTR